MKHENKKILALILLAIFMSNFLFFGFVGEVKALGQACVDDSACGAAFGSGEICQSGVCVRDTAAEASIPPIMDSVLGTFGKIVGTAAELGAGLASGGTIWIVNSILFVIAKFVGALVYMTRGLMEYALNITNIGNVEIVNKGWALSRDIANMFFILILLIISFGTILRIEGWGYERLLPKLITAALLINFSKVIALALIDASQILTLFFIKLYPPSVISEILANTFKINEALSFAVTFALAPVTTFFALIVEIIFDFLTIMAFGVLAFLFLVRIVAFWFLIILAPFVWLLGILPKFQNYVNMWWNKFIKWLIFAPVATFLLSLSVIAMKQTHQQLFATFATPPNPSIGENIKQFFPLIMKPQNFLSASLSFMFLFGSMYVAQMVSNAAPGVFFAGAKAIKGALPGALGKMGKTMFMKERPPAAPPSGRTPPLRPSVVSPGPKPEEPPPPPPSMGKLTLQQQQEAAKKRALEEKIAEEKAAETIEEKREQQWGGISSAEIEEQAAQQRKEEERKRKLFGPSMMKSPVLENIRQRAILMKEQMTEVGKKHPLISSVFGDFFAPMVKASLAGTGIFKKQETDDEKFLRKMREQERKKAKEEMKAEKASEEEGGGEKT